MTKDQIFRIAKYVQLPEGIDGQASYKDFGDLPLGRRVVRLPLTNTERYDGWYSNWHHYTTKYHRDVLLPLISYYMKFPYDKRSYTVFPKKSGKYDISYFVPDGHNHMKFDAYSFSDGIEYHDMSYDWLMWDDSDPYGLTDYHRLFRFAHKPVRIVNRNPVTDRILLLSCDSQMIPSAAFLCSVFREVWHLDNRDNKRIAEKYRDVGFTDALFVLHAGEPSFYLEKNLS